MAGPFRPVARSLLLLAAWLSRHAALQPYEEILINLPNEEPRMRHAAAEPCEEQAAVESQAAGESQGGPYKMASATVLHDSEAMQHADLRDITADEYDEELAGAKALCTDIAQKLVAGELDATSPYASYALGLAAQMGDLELSKQLLDLGAPTEPPTDEEEDAPSALLLAADAGHLETASLLLSRGADPDATSATYQGATALFRAAEEDDAALARELLRHKASTSKVDEHGVTPLLAAAVAGHTEIVSALLDANASVEVVPTKVDYYKKALAVMRSRLPDLGCIEAAQRGELSPLFVAAVTGNAAVVALILQHRPAGLYAEDECILRMVAWQGNAEVAALLLDYSPPREPGGPAALLASVGAGGSVDVVTEDSEGGGSSSSVGTPPATPSPPLLASQCPEISAAEAMKRFDVNMSALPEAAVVRQCAASDATHGGVLVVEGFVTPEERSGLGEVLTQMLAGRVGSDPHAADAASGADDTYASSLIFWQVPHTHAADATRQLPRTQLLSSLGERLRASPGVPPPLPKGTILRTPDTEAEHLELLQVVSYTSSTRDGANPHAGGVPTSARYSLAGRGDTQGEPIFAMHHDRNKKLNRFATVLISVANVAKHEGSTAASSSAPVVGGHTLFPLLGPHVEGTPGCDARHVLEERVAKSAAALSTDPRAARLFWDDPPVQRAIRTLCDEAIKAEATNSPPPCLAVPPTPGAAVLFWSWGRDDESTYGLRPESSNVHFGCPVFNVHKLTVQSFRELPSDSPLWM